MYLTTVMLSKCCHALEERAGATNEKKLNTTARVLVSCTLTDALISMTALVNGILGIVGIIPGMPPAAAYTLVSLSGVITLSWVAMAVMSKGKIFSYVGYLLKAAVASDPSYYIGSGE